ncbi:MAG: hypothetical protein LJF04_14765 [Gemmatimonadetes bacterium]|nr:hypothetical protein [Gemmatimonadota bacterium]
MRPSRSLFFLLAAAVLATACSSSSSPADVTGPTPLTVADLVGQWNATSMVFTNNADASQTFDLIAAGGDARFTMLTGGKVRNFLDLGDFHDQWDALVTMNSSDMTLTATPAESTRPVQHYAFTLSGTTLTLTNKDATFDFTLTGATGVSATSVTVFTKTAS